MKQIIYLTVAMAGYVMAENPLNIPETLSGNQFDFILQNGNTQLFDGMATETMGANGDNLAPTLILMDSCKF